MFDLFSIEKYKENNRLEAKAAAVGLPKSLWATYSAFANTNGGVILLGVTEDAKHQLHIDGVNDAEALVIDFWNIINNQGKVSINILSDKNVTIQELDGRKIIVIDVPRAQRYDKPIYLDANLLSSYKRNGEGDYRCTKEAIQAMLRDASPKTQDMLVLGVVCSKRLLNQAVGKSLRTHNLKPKKGAQAMRKNEKITALYERLSRDDFGKDDDQQRESNSIRTNGQFSRIPMSLSLTSRPLTLCRKSVGMSDATRTAGAKQLPSQACFIVPIAAARCMSTAPITASAFLNTPAHSTPKFLAERSARPSTVSMKMWYCPLSLKCSKPLPSMRSMTEPSLSVWCRKRSPASRPQRSGNSGHALPPQSREFPSWKSCSAKSMRTTF